VFSEELCSGNCQLEETTRAKLYVAITQAFFSVGIVVEDNFNKTVPGKHYGRVKGERHYPLWDNASRLLFRIGLGYGSTSFPIKPRPYTRVFVC